MKLLIQQYNLTILYRGKDEGNTLKRQLKIRIKGKNNKRLSINADEEWYEDNPVSKFHFHFFAGVAFVLSRMSAHFANSLENN